MCRKKAEKVETQAAGGIAKSRAGGTRCVNKSSRLQQPIAPAPQPQSQPVARRRRRNDNARTPAHSVGARVKGKHGYDPENLGEGHWCVYERPHLGQIGSVLDTQHDKWGVVYGVVYDSDAERGEQPCPEHFLVKA